MIVLVDPNDSRAVRNKDNVLALYELMINRKKSEEGTAKFVSPAYIQHNPLIPDGPVALGQFFGKVTRAKTRRHNQSDTPRGAGGLVSGAASKAVVPLVEASRYG